MRILICLSLFSLSMCAPQGEPQSGTNCGTDPITGAVRAVGDSWSPDGCNNCRCLSTGVPGCTKRLCDFETGSKGCIEGAHWEQKSGDDIKVCTCQPGAKVSCTDTQTIQDRNIADCGVDSEGERRQIGDSWMEDCNRCTCISPGRPGCSKKFCGSSLPLPAPVPVEASSCQDGEVTRKDGEEWSTATSECTCMKGLIGCSDIIKPVTKPHGLGDLGIPEKEDTRSIPDCGVDIDGRKRMVGDTWMEDCNSCFCGETGSGCTLIFCGGDLPLPVPVPVEASSCQYEGVTRQDGEEWSTATSQCTCMKGLIGCSDIIKPVTKPHGLGDLGIPEKEDTRAVADCGVDADGRKRMVGDTWMEDCNSCFCGEGGSGCTLKFCGGDLPVPVPVEVSSCQIQGVTREDGEQWIDGNSKCTCIMGSIGCSDIIKPVTKPHGLGDLGIPEKEDTRAGSVSFPSSSDRTRDEGASATEGALSLLTKKDLDLTNVIQCQQDGVEKCTAVEMDIQTIRSLRAQAKLTLLPGFLPMQMRRDPEVTSSGGLSLAFILEDGGEASLVVGVTGSMYGNIRPDTGDSIYALEGCGKGCNVILERNKDYFNQFQD